jgi:cyanophycinase
MGGSTDVDEAFQWMAERGGGGDFLILRGSGADGYQEYVDEIAEVNSVDTLVLKDRAAAYDEFVLDRVARADAIFLAGGDQWNYVGKWKDTPLLEQLNKAILDGVPLGGTSAGLAVLGEHVFTAEKNTITSQEALHSPFDGAITLDSDFLKAPPLANLITDSHFSERDRMGRLVTFMSRLQNDRNLESVRGVGVDEKTAVLVEPNGQARTVGQGDAHFVQATHSPEECVPSRPLTQKNLTVHTVKPGQSFDLATWSSQEVTPQIMSVDRGVLTISQ